MSEREAAGAMIRGLMVGAEAVRQENAKLRKAIIAVLLFESGAPWSPEAQRLWETLTGENEASSRALCAFLRRVLGEAIDAQN